MSKRSPRLLFTDEEMAAPELKKAIRKADKRMKKLENAEAKIPKKTVKKKQRVVDPKTGTGTDSSNAEVNLPQTGNNSMTNWLLCVGAALFIAFGFGAVKASGIFKRKEDE